MSTTNERAQEQAVKADLHERRANLYDPHFPAKRRAVQQDRAAVFDPHFPARGRA